MRALVCMHAFVCVACVRVVCLSVCGKTLFDMASLTKVLSTTTAAMLLYQWGHLNLDMKVSDPQLLGPGFAVNGKGDISLKNLLLHNAGYPPDPSPNYC